MNDTKNFKASEFACKHCGKNEVSQKLIDMCQKIRDAVNAPIRINSGYRCPVHNANVGGVKGSNHTKGLAADLSSSVGAQKLFDTIKSLYNAGTLPELGYCILYQRKNFVHADIVKRASGNIWEVRA